MLHARFRFFGRWLAFCAVLLVNVSCNNPNGGSGTSDSEWLKGNAEEKFEAIARHLRGFDMAMVETGHRYAELYWAGRDNNWQYAKYQIQKLRLAVENGLERRPKRAESAKTFLTFVIPEVEQAVDQQDSALFWNRFGALTSTCNACHAAENVAFINVAPPAVRLSPVQQQEEHHNRNEGETG
ncbi:MAG: hypothetical protein KF749_11085 [Bacteroidetes bacterium]|nr:hypothetical protein [Bacteroidota bacterium]MCW5896071.1 hypothetical protein [Bacteroidota bacterium]